MSATEIETASTPKCIKIVHSVEFQTKLGKLFGRKTKLYIPSTIKTDYLIWHPQLIYSDKKGKIINFLPFLCKHYKPRPCTIKWRQNQQ